MKKMSKNHRLVLVMGCWRLSFRRGTRLTPQRV
jgi:hypothetical protein